MEIQATRLSAKGGLSQRQSFSAWIWLCGVFVLLMIFVKQVPVGGDSLVYARDIESSLSHGWAESHQLWNFSHLIWRPLGRLMAELFLSPLLPVFNGNVDMAMSFLLVVPNFICALLCGLLVQRMVWKMIANQWAALIAGVAFLCLNPLLNYSRLGSPYCCCLGCITVALYLAAFYPGNSWKTAILAGMLGGVAVVLWAPLLLSFPAIALSRWILDIHREKKANFRFAATICIAGAVTVLACYVATIAITHIYTWSELIAWVHESTPDSRDQKAIRMVNGFARGFYEMGDDSVWLKWYLFHDPYAKVHIWDLLKLTFSELAMFYLALVTLIVTLWTSPTGKRLLALIAIATLPELGLALLYESGSVERYIPFLPVLFLGFGYAIGSPFLSFIQRVVVAIICCLHAPANIATASVRNIGYLVHKDPDRLAVMTSLAPKDVLFVVNIRDSLFRLSWGDSLNSLHRHPMGLARPITPPVAPEIPYWRATFACAVFSTWNNQGEVWVTDRVLASQPIRDWSWVEGDVSLKWDSIHRFFLDYGHSQERGGKDGFFLLQNTPETRQKLLSNIPGGGEQGCAPYYHP